jgi:hypothetical protein
MGLSGQLIIIPFLSFVGGTSGVKLQSKNSVYDDYIISGTHCPCTYSYIRHFIYGITTLFLDCSLTPLVPPTKERKGIMINCPERPIAAEDKERIFKGSNWEPRLKI